jgi:hypothetical protein
MGIADRLSMAVAAVCPIDGVSIGDERDRSTWRVAFMSTATNAQKLAAQAVIDAFSVTAKPLWREGQVMGIIDPGVGAGGANPHTEIIYQNAVTDEGYLPAGAWHTIDAGKTFYGVDTGIPQNAIAIWLSGVLIITCGLAAEVADLQLYCRRLGATNADGDIYLCAQTTAVGPSGGARTNFTTVVPLVDRKFELWWYRSTGGFWNANSSYGIIAWPIAYLR